MTQPFKISNDVGFYQRTTQILLNSNFLACDLLTLKATEECYHHIKVEKKMPFLSNQNISNVPIIIAWIYGKNNQFYIKM